MKRNEEKIKGRTTYSDVDAAWKRAQKAAKLRGMPISQYLRDAVNEATERDLKAGKK